MSTPKAKKNPNVGQTMTGADMIMQVLAAEGVDTVFGYSGGAILPTYDAVFRYNNGRAKKNQIQLVVPANEQGAGFMAAGYSRASGKVGCLIVTSGPGATNCATPIRDCMADSIPVVMISGQVARSAIGTDAFQEAPVFNIFTACAKHVFLVSNEAELESTVRSAFHIARSGRPGPVVIDVPKDVQNHPGIFQGQGMLDLKGYGGRLEALQNARISPKQAESFFEMLMQSRRPLIYAGGGVINANAATELRQFAERYKIPVVTTLMGIGSIDTTHELALHMLGMHGAAYANYAVDECDFMIAVGARFDDRVAGKVSEFAPHARVAHIDVDAAEIGKVKNVDWAHVGDCRLALRDLLDAGKAYKTDFAQWRKHVQILRKKHRFDYDRQSPMIQPQFAIQTLNEITCGDAIVCTGVGQHQMQAAQYFDFHQPRTFITSGSMGTMGFGLPAAIGAQFACPGKTVIDVDGDGSIRMNLGEMETATTYGAPVKILLLNNLGDGRVRQWQKLYFNNRFSGTDKSLHKKDFVKAAEADGFGFAQRVAEKADLRKVLEKWVGYDGPAFLEVMCDQDACVFPMVGPGMGYKDMMTGPYITPREEILEEVTKQEMELATSDSF